MSPTIAVQVKTPEGKIIPVVMEPSDKIEFIKEKVEQGTGVHVEDQTLKFNDKELPNEKTADDMGLVDGSMIDLMGAEESSSSSSDDDKSTDCTSLCCAECAPAA